MQEGWRPFHAAILCDRLPVLDVSCAFGALSAANRHFPLLNHHIVHALRRPLVTEDNHYAVRSRLSDRQIPVEHR